MIKIKNLLVIHLAFFIYSLASLFSKKAGTSEDVILFLLFYGMSFFCLGIYAIVWQKILQKNSLVFAYLNKAVTIVWGLIFGILIFNEKVTLNMIIGVIIVVIGVVIVNYGEAK